MKKLLTLLFLTSLAVIAGLPPTSTKGAGDSSFLTTFQFDFANIPLTHSGTKATLGTIPISQGGTGATSRNFVDLVSNESIGGTKTFTNTISGSINGNASTVTTNANLTGEVTSVGNAATLTNSAVIGKVLTGYVSGAGTVAATDTILQAIQKLNGNKATNANLTGPITSVGNATSIASQTGTGTKFVVDTSPTLVTPNIGAATGTSLSVSGQLTSTVATGTAPLAVSSTTKVTNLYADRAALADTVTTNSNLTGPITSIGNATSVASQTGTGSTFVMDTGATLVNPTLGTANASAIILGAGAVGAPSLTFTGDTDNGLYYVGTNQWAAATGGIQNTLYSPSFTKFFLQLIGANGTAGAPEYSFTGSTTSGMYRDNATNSVRLSNAGVDTITTTSTNQVGIGTSSPNTNAILDVSSTTKAFIPPRMTTAQKLAIASPTAGMEVYDSTLGQPSYYDGTTWQTGLGTTTVDTDFVNAGAPTVTSVGGGLAKGTVVVDRFWVKRNGQMLEGIYQYQQSATGTAGSGEYIFSLPTGYAFDTSIITPFNGAVTNTSNTAISLANVGSGMIGGGSTGQVTANCRLIAYSSTQYRAFCVGGNGNASATQWLVSAAQQGYVESATLSYSFNIRAPISGWSSNASTFSGAGVNTDWASYTPTITGLGTVTNIAFKYKKSGDSYVVSGSFTAGTSAASLVSFTLPNSATIDSTKIPLANTTANPGSKVGTYGTNVSTNLGNIVTATGTSTSLVYAAGNYGSAGITIIPTNGSSIITTGAVTSVEFTVPISGFSNLSQVVANISGYAQAPGVAGTATPNVDHLVFTFGNSSTTVCSSATCGYLDQLGTGVTSVTRSGTGLYTFNFARTYSKIKCFFQGYNGTAAPVSPGAGVPQTANSNTLSWGAYLTSSNVASDALGNADCWGIY